MIIINYFDYFGDEEGLRKWDEDVKRACEKTKGVTYLGRYSSHQARYHWAWFFEAESYDRLAEADSKVTIVRDRNLLTHTVEEMFSGPFHK